jgi:hypothetical protein
MALWDTAHNVINDTAFQLGLIVSAVADPYTSTEPNVILLRALLKDLGRNLLREHGWTHLQKVHTFDTEAATAAYDLPEDSARTISGTYWNRGQLLPMGGPLSPQEWQALKSGLGVTAFQYYFRVYGDLMYLHPTPSSVVTIAYEYQSTWWVQGENDPDAPSKANPTDKDDTLWFDPRLLTTGLKLAFLTQKGMDTSAAANAYERALAHALGMDGASPTLSISGGGVRPFRPIDGLNLPDTGFGS